MDRHVKRDCFQVYVSWEIGQNNISRVLAQMMGHLKQREQINVLDRADIDLAPAQKLIALEKC